MDSKTAEIARRDKPGRIDRGVFDSATFPSVMELPVRFTDLDLLCHVNNVAIIALLQEGRVHFNRTMSLPPLDGGQRPVVGAMNVEYAAEVNYPGMVEICSGIFKLGRSSYSFAQLVRQNCQSVAYAQTVMVVTNKAGLAPIPVEFCRAIEECCMIRR